MEDRMERFTDYYTCFYEKHFELYKEMYPRVDAFLDSVLAQVEAEGGADPPSEACLGWMCDPGLRWRLLTTGASRLWTYTSPQPVTSWGQCFDDTNNQDFNQLPQGIQRAKNVDIKKDIDMQVFTKPLTTTPSLYCSFQEWIVTIGARIFCSRRSMQ